VFNSVPTWPATVPPLQPLLVGDGCGFIVQKRMADWVDGKQVLIEGEPLVSSSGLMPQAIHILVFPLRKSGMGIEHPLHSISTYFNPLF
jgi:hypothetical protein